MTVRDPSPEELAAIVAAVELTWPRPSPAEEPAPVPSWRFSGRWWNVAPRSWPHRAFASRVRPR